MIYLETNALRILANRLHDSNFVQDKYTSVLSIIELLSGINDEKEYQRRRGIIRKVMRSKIYGRIHPLFPSTIFYKAFGIQKNDLELSLNVTDLLILISEIPSYSSLVDFLCKHIEFQKYFYFVQNFDTILSKSFIEFIVDKASDTDTKRLIPEFNTRWEERDFNSILHRVVHYYASKISSSLIGSKTQEEFVDAYDRSINPFLLAVSYYVDQKISLKNTVAKNDSMDLLHLLYIRESDIIVSDDKLLHSILTIAYPNSILKASEID